MVIYPFSVKKNRVNRICKEFFCFVVCALNLTLIRLPFCWKLCKNLPQQIEQPFIWLFLYVYLLLQNSKEFLNGFWMKFIIGNFLLKAFLYLNVFFQFSILSILVRIYSLNVKIFNVIEMVIFVEKLH